MNSTILITTAIKPPSGVPFLQMTNEASRYITSKGSVFFWAGYGIKKIVIADSTGGSLLDPKEIILLEQMGIDIEQISYQQDNDLIKSKGKGYGEGELIKFALQNSLILKKENNFFKCTGKVFCRNFGTIFKVIEKDLIQNIFWKHISLQELSKPWTDLRFFYTTKKFCEENIIPAYLQSNDNNFPAEYLCFNVLNDKLQKERALRPHLSGFSGAYGKAYIDLDFGMLDVAWPCLMGF